MTRLFLNDNIVSHKSQRGVARYWLHITDGVIARFGLEVTIRSRLQRDYKEAIHITPPNFLKIQNMRIMQRLGLANIISAFDRYVVERTANHTQAQLMMSPYYGYASCKMPQIFVVHDMIHELYFLNRSPKAIAVKKFIDEKRECIMRGSKLIAVSNSTANDILSLYPDVPADKIEVVHHGVDDFFFKGSSSKAPRMRPYFLFVGHRNEYKNFLCLLKAYGQSGLANNYDLLVISPSQGEFSLLEKKVIENYSLKDHVILSINASEESLRQAYIEAYAFIYPSQYEGFGLPILEAMACGTLVATSNTSSMPEVGGDVAYYFDPRNTGSVVDALRQLANLSFSERVQRSALGVKHARMFTWEKCQQATINIIENLL